MNKKYNSYNQVSNKRFLRVMAALLVIFFLNTQSQALGGENSDSSAGLLDEIRRLIPDSTIIENKVVYVDFWASWCAPCIKSFPWMEKLLTKYSDSGLVIITINLDKDNQKAVAFLEKQNITSVNLFDSKGSLAKAFGIRAMPTSFAYGRDGELVFEHKGFRNSEAKEFEGKILSLLREGNLGHE